jgi:hypothetical protein
VPHRHRSSQRVRRPFNEIGCSIVHYLVTHPIQRQLPVPDPNWIGASRYEIRNKLAGGTQHDQIIGDALERLLEMNLIQARTSTGGDKYYRMTDHGLEWWKSLGEGFLDFSRKFRRGNTP